MSLDLRLLEVPFELDTLEEHLSMIEEQMDRSSESAKLMVNDVIKEQNLTPCAAEWNLIWQWHFDHVDIVLPRILRYSFLVSLYAVYESTVTEVADLMRKRVGQKISLYDIRGSDFARRADKYYNHILQFQLSRDSQIWERVIVLSGLRNAIAHTNGRMDRLNKRARERIRKWETKLTGIECDTGYVIVSEDFLKETFTLVKGDLEDLIVRFKAWDDARREQAQSS